MNWKIQSNWPGSKILHMVVILPLFCFSPFILFGNNQYNPRNDAPQEAWEMVTPYLMPETHPLKQKLDILFSQNYRVIEDRDSLRKAGFDPDSLSSKVVVTRHSQMPGYVFKIYTDDGSCSQGRPEYKAFMLRARGAELIRQEIARRGWQAYFKAPIKWIYPLPQTTKAKSCYVQKNFILVEEDMDILSKEESRKRWSDGSITPLHLQMLFHIITTIGLRDCSKCNNIPISKDGRIAFIDTSGHDRQPFYDRLFDVLNKELKTEWKRLINERKQQ